MKNRIIKLLILTLATTLIFTGCKGPGEKDDSESAKVTEEEKENEEEVDTPVTVITHHVVCKDGDKVIATGEYPEISFSKKYKKKYERAWYVVQDKNLEWEKSVKEAVALYGNYVTEFDEMPDAPYESKISIEIDRFDDTMISASVGSYDECGGAHPGHFVDYLNIDTELGEKPTIYNVISDTENFAKDLRTEMAKAYPENMDTIDEYFYPGEDSEETDVFQYMFDQELISYEITEEGLYIVFSPYEIAPYAFGYMDVTLSYKDYPDLIEKRFRLDKKQDLSKLVSTKDGDTVEVEPGGIEDTSGTGTTYIDNPTWERYMDEDQTASEHHITLTETSKEKTDWLNTEDWAKKHGFDLASPSYSDESYTYTPIKSDDDEYGYQYTHLQIYEKDSETLLHDLDLNTLCNGPDARAGKESQVKQFLRYAKIVDDILYVSVGHMGYATEERNSNYMVAIDLTDNYRVLFKTEPLTSNATNFAIVDDTIICGYGFTDEPDCIYLLDRFTGDRITSIPVNSQAEQFNVKGDVLYVATYNTAYEYHITK